MFDFTPHRRVALVALAALVALSGAAAGASVTAATDVSPSGDADGSVASVDSFVASSDANVTIDHEGPLVLGAASNQSVRIRSDAPAGTDVTVALRSTRYNVLKSSEVTVGDDGTGTATFNLSRVEPGASFTVTVRDSDATADGVVVNESATVHRDATFPVSDPAPDYAIRGQVVNFATELDVDLAVEGSTYSETVAVDEDGAFAASFDLSSVSSGAEATVEVDGNPRSVSTVVVTQDSLDPTAYVLVEPANATILYPEETLLVHPKSDQTVYGTTNLRPGTELAVTAENDEPNSPNAFTRTATVTVREDGTFVAELNVTGVETGTNFSVGVGPGLARMNGRVVNESVTLPTVTTTEPTAKPTTDESAFTTETTTTTPDDDDDGHTDEFVPGFGVPAALVALLAALALARQRGA